VTENEIKALKLLLIRDVVVVNLTKKDGSTKVMTCTLKYDMIPEEKTPKNTEKSLSNNNLTVFDLKKQEWRSFSVDSVNYFGRKTKNA
jgi:hypothetical protein